MLHRISTIHFESRNFGDSGKRASVSAQTTIENPNYSVIGESGEKSGNKVGDKDQLNTLVLVYQLESAV